MGRSALAGGLVLGAMSVTLGASPSFDGGRLMVRTTYRTDRGARRTLALIAGSARADHADARRAAWRWASGRLAR